MAATPVSSSIVTPQAWLPRWQRRDRGPLWKELGRDLGAVGLARLLQGLLSFVQAIGGLQASPGFELGSNQFKQKLFFFWWNDRNGWATPSGVQGILPALCSGVILDCDQGDHTRCPLLLYSLLPLQGTSRSLDCVPWAEKVGPVVL